MTSPPPDTGADWRYIAHRGARKAASLCKLERGESDVPALVQRTSKRSIDELARDELFAPLGIEDVEWIRYPGGDVNAVSGLRMRPRDLAKLGQLVVDGGVLNGKPIVSGPWLGQSLAPQINGEGLYFYGFQWWLGRSLVERTEITWAAAFGYGGQRMFIVPRLGLVAVVMAGLYDNPAFQSVVGDVVLRRYALAAVTDG